MNTWDKKQQHPPTRRIKLMLVPLACAKKFTTLLIIVE